MTPHAPPHFSLPSQVQAPEPLSWPSIQKQLLSQQQGPGALAAAAVAALGLGAAVYRGIRCGGSVGEGNMRGGLLAKWHGFGATN